MSTDVGQMRERLRVRSVMDQIVEAQVLLSTAHVTAVRSNEQVIAQKLDQTLMDLEETASFVGERLRELGG